MYIKPKSSTKSKFETSCVQYIASEFDSGCIFLPAYQYVNSFVLNERNKLESEFQIISAVVEEISKQVEQAKLQLKKDTPVFSTIQEAVIPIYRSSPKRTQLVIIFGFVGFILSCLVILIKDPLTNIFLEIKNN